MSQLWVKPPLSLPHRCRLPAHWDVVSSLQVFRGLSGDKGSIYCNWIPCSCTGLGSRSHLCYRPGLWPSLPVAGTEDGGSAWTGNPPPCLGAEPCSQERAVKQAGSFLLPSPCSPWLRGGSWPQHLSVTSRKDQPPNRTTTGTRQDGSARTCTLTRGHAHGAGEQEDTHLLELLSLSLVFDVTPSAKQPERSPSEGAWAGGTGAARLSPSTTDQGQDSTGLPKNLQPSTHWDESVPRGQGRHLSPFAGNPGTCRGMLPGEDRDARRACLADVKALGFPGRGKVECTGRRMLAGEQVQHAHSGQGRARLCRHRDGGACLWGWGWDAQRQDSDRMGQSLGLCLLRLILVLRPPHRGLLAAACPSQALHWPGGVEPGRELMPQLRRPWGTCHYSAVLGTW